MSTGSSSLILTTVLTLVLVFILINIWETRRKGIALINSNKKSNENITSKIDGLSKKNEYNINIDLESFLQELLVQLQLQKELLDIGILSHKHSLFLQ